MQRVAFDFAPRLTDSSERKTSASAILNEKRLRVEPEGPSSRGRVHLNLFIYRLFTPYIYMYIYIYLYFYIYM